MLIPQNRLSSILVNCYQSKSNIFVTIVKNVYVIVPSQKSKPLADNIDCPKVVLFRLRLRRGVIQKSGTRTEGVGLRQSKSCRRNRITCVFGVLSG